MAENLADMKALLGQLAIGRRLSIEESRRAFDIMMSGDATPAQMGAFLMALRIQGETVENITGGAMAMRAKATSIVAPEGAIDTCGTGGDASGTYNVSTGVALIVAGAGVTVAKHGNKALSSKSGSADVLAALGVNINADMGLVQRALDEVGLCFMMAPRHHGAMRHVAGARVELGTRTIFNLMGPLSNPAGAKLQLIGVFADEWVEPLARVLRNLGTRRAWVVHGDDGLDELTVTAPSQVAELRDGEVRRFTVTPEDAGLKRSAPADLIGGDVDTNSQALRDLLAGHHGAYRDICVLNAAAALVVADRARDLAEGARLAAQAIDSGAARAKLKSLVAITASGAPA